MTIRARLPQPCMAFCGGEIIPGMRIEEGPNGWQHTHCEHVGEVNYSRPPADRPSRATINAASPPTPKPYLRPPGLSDEESALLEQIHDKYRVNQAG